MLVRCSQAGVFTEQLTASLAKLDELLLRKW